MKKFLLLALVATYTSITAQNINYQWANGIGSVNEEDETIQVATDQDDNTYFACQTHGAVTLGTTQFQAPDANGRDIVLGKYNSNGELLWSGNIAGDGATGNVTFGDLLGSIHVDNNGDLIIAGNLGSNASILGTAINNSDNRNFVSKISSEGDVMWTVIANDDFGGDLFFEVSTNSQNEVFVCGQSGPSGTEWYGIGGVLLNGEPTFTDFNEPIISKISPDGNVQWVKFLETKGPNQLEFDSNDNLIVSSRLASGAEAGFYLSKFEAETLNPIWERYAANNNSDPRSRNIGFHVRPDDSIIQFIKSSTDIDFGDGFSSTSAGFSPMGMLVTINADGSTSSINEMTNLITNPAFVTATSLTFDPQSISVIDDDSFLIGANLLGDLEIASGGTISPDPWYLENFGDPRDALVIQLDANLNLEASATNTGTGWQSGTTIAALSNGDAVLGGFFENESFGGFTGNTVFGDIPLASAGARDYFVTRVTPGQDSGLSTDDLGDLRFSVYPNPTSSFINISLEEDQLGAAYVSVNDITGKQVFRKRITNASRGVQFDLSQLENGIYLLNVEAEGLIGTKKIIINR